MDVLDWVEQALDGVGFNLLQRLILAKIRNVFRVLTFLGSFSISYGARYISRSFKVLMRNNET